ncbi:hypothetical protein D3C79_501060 [compost metagenome]
MLACAGFRDDLGFAHAFGKQRLAQYLVGLMGTAVQQIFTLQVELGFATGSQVFAQRQCRWATRIVFQQIDKLCLELWVTLGADEGLFQLFQGWHQNLRHVLTAKFAEVRVKQRHYFSRYYPLNEVRNQ